MSRTKRKTAKKTKTKNSNIGRKFVIFVKQLDEYGYVDESKCGWLNFNNQMDRPEFAFSFRDGQVFVEKESGHGSFADWKKFFEDEHPDWMINPEPLYLD